MVESYSITTERDLIARLQKLICCSESQSTCRNGEFCSSDPETWPVIVNGKTMVRLAYPEDENSIPGITELADAYTEWHSKTGCGTLAKEIATVTDETSRLTLFTDSGVIRDGILALFTSDVKSNPFTEFKAKELEEKLANVDKALKRRCSIMYEAADDGELEFNPKRAEDLESLGKFSWSVVKGDDGNSSWWDYFKGGGILGLAWFGVWLLYKIVRVFRTGSKHMKDTGFILKGLGEGLNALTSGMRYLFGTAVPNFLKALKYAVTFGWLRGKELPKEIEPPKDIAPQPAVEAAVGTPEVVVITPTGDPSEIISPHPDVVLAQFQTMVGSRHHQMEGERFAKLSDTGKRYLANLAIKRWANETPSRRQLFIEDDDRLTEGKLPTEFLLRVARHYLRKDANIDILEASARVWVKQNESPPVPRTEAALASEFKPTAIDVKRQLLNDPSFQRASAATRDYMSLMAIAEWDSMVETSRQSFIRVDDSPENGMLPKLFIRYFRKRVVRNVRDVRNRARLYASLQDKMPKIVEYPFNLVDMRLKHIVDSWFKVSEGVKKAFVAAAKEEAEDYSRGIPEYFAEYLFKVISISTVARLPANKSVEPWTYDGHPGIVYEGYNLSKVMERITTSNDKLRHYPDLLKVRGKSIIEAWLILHKTVRTEFTSLDDTQETRKGEMASAEVDDIPRRFVTFIYEFSTGIGTSTRPFLKKPHRADDDEINREGGAGGASTIPPVVEPSEVRGQAAAHGMVGSSRFASRAPLPLAAAGYNQYVDRSASRPHMSPGIPPIMLANPAMMGTFQAMRGAALMTTPFTGGAPMMRAVGH